MIPQQYIKEWGKDYPWKNIAFVEQDLIICCAICALYNDEYLATKNTQQYTCLSF
jgi:hypothetical protein